MGRGVAHVHLLLCHLAFSCDLTFNLLGVGPSSAVCLRWVIGNVMGRGEYDMHTGLIEIDSHLSYKKKVFFFP